MREWSFAELNGYEPKTTFWQDFTIAEPFGKDAVKDTAARAFDEWKDNIEYLTELVMVLNHLCWYWYKYNAKSSWVDYYSDLYYEYNDKAYKYLESKNDKAGLAYYFTTLD